MAKWRIYQYYLIIAVVSLIALVFLPMCGSTIGLAWNIPNTVAGWIVYVMSKLLVATINILIFHCFVQQGKLNVKDNQLYKEANEIMLLVSKDQELIPKHPNELIGKLYRSKGITIFITTLGAAIGLTQAVLTFDLLVMGTYLVTIVLGIIFGIFTMNEVESIWTEDYWKYAQKVKSDNEQYEQLRLEKELEQQKKLEEDRIKQQQLAELQRAEEEKQRLRREAEEAFKRKQEQEFEIFMASYTAGKGEESISPEPLPEVLNQI